MILLADADDPLAGSALTQRLVVSAAQASGTGTQVGRCQAQAGSSEALARSSESEL